MGKYMDNLPTVISCCFCCFLRAGSVVIAVFSFIAGVILAPNVANTSYWPYGVMNTPSAPLEGAMQVLLGWISIVLCINSILLLVGALCNIPKLIEVYQWGAVLYCGTTVLIYLILSMYCFIVNGHCLYAGFTLLFFIFLNTLLTTYFVIVVNSLRLSMAYLNTGSLEDTV